MKRKRKQIGKKAEMPSLVGYTIVSNFAFGESFSDLFFRLANFSTLAKANISHMQSKYFIAKPFHLPKRANFTA